jgi:hypothetical protein
MTILAGFSGIFNPVPAHTLHIQRQIFPGYASSKTKKNLHDLLGWHTQPSRVEGITWQQKGSK